MTYFNMFKQPYLDGDDGVNLGGGGLEPAATETQSTEEQQPTITTETTQQATEQPKIKIKFNHEEKELGYDEAVPYIQKGMNYDKAIEKAKQEAMQLARDTYIAEQGYEWKGKPITTEAEYKQAIAEKELEDKIRSQYSNVPDEIVNELLEGRKFRENYNAKEQELNSIKQKEKDYTDFSEWYTKTKGKEPNPEDIPVDVWQAVEKGTPLKIAFMEHDYIALHNQIKQGEQQQQIQQANQKNAQNSTGSVKSNGNTNAFISKEQFEANKSDPNWVRKNLNKLEESRLHW